MHYYCPANSVFVSHMTQGSLIQHYINAAAIIPGRSGFPVNLAFRSIWLSCRSSFPVALVTKN
jgi:hypothetical protein